MTDTSASVQSDSKLRGRSARKRNLLVGLLASAALLVCLYLFATRGEVSTDDAQVDGRLVPIAPKISGYIEKLLVNDNQALAPGQLIALIDPRDEKVQVEQAAASLGALEAQARAAGSNVGLTANVTSSSVASAEAAMANAEAELLHAKATAERAHHADLEHIRADIEDRKASYVRAHSDLLRMQRLIEKGEISSIQYDRYVATERSAKSQLDAAQQSLLSQQKVAQADEATVHSAEAKLQKAKAELSLAHAEQQQVKVRADDADALRAGVEAARAKLDAAKLQLSYTEIRAPREGKVTRRTVESGAYVTPGQTLLTLVPTQDIWITANFKETQLRHVKPGDRADITVDQLGKTFTGSVDSIAGATGTRSSLLPPENATGNYVKVVQRVPVRILLDAEALHSGALSVGNSVEVTIHTH